MDLSQTAKLVYSLLLDRSDLSKKNGWIDEQGRIYVFFPITNIAETVHKGITVVKDSLKELETAGLIERKRNYSAPNTIYVKLPDSRETGHGIAGKAAITEPENRPCDSRKTGKSIAGKASTSKTNNSQTEVVRTIAAAVPRTDSDLAEIIQHFEQAIGIFPRSALDKLQRWREVYPAEIIRAAIDEAAENNVRKWRYVDGVLKGWQADGVRTLGDVEARREARKKPEQKERTMLT